MICGELLLQLRLFWVCLGRYPPKPATFVRCVSGKSPRVYLVYNVMPCANVGSKPWYRCGCTNDIPCRLDDAGSMTFLPWFAPRTEPPVPLREVGPDRGHLLNESCSDVHLHVCRCRTGDGDCCCCTRSVGSRRQNITACTGVIFAR